MGVNGYSTAEYHEELDRVQRLRKRSIALIVLAAIVVVVAAIVAVMLLNGGR